MLINVHVPRNDKILKQQKETRLEFWEEVDHLINNIPDYHIKILVGVFNTQTGLEKKFRNVTGKWKAHTNIWIEMDKD